MESDINEKFTREKDFLFADFLIADEKDEEGTVTFVAPRNYEAVTDL